MSEDQRIPRKVYEIVENYFDLINTLKGVSNKLGINTTSAMMLASIPPSGISPSKLLQHRTFNGTSATYNLQNLEKNGFISREKDLSDRRSNLILPTKKGMDASTIISAALSKQVKESEW